MPAVTSVTNFSDGNVLTASALNAVNCGIHVYSNAAARDAAYGGSGERTLVEGEYAYLLDTDQTLVYSGSSWITVGVNPGLVCVKAETAFSAVASVTADSVFTSTYTNYKIVMNYTTNSTLGTLCKLRVGGVSASTNYNTFYAASQGWSVGTVLANSTFVLGDYSNGAFNCNQILEIQQPAIATGTTFWSNATTSRGSYSTPYPQYTIGNHSTATAYDGIEFLVSSGTMSGTYTIYGYSKAI